jgi:hypothetical protein
MSKNQKNRELEGEGSYSGTRKYNAGVAETVASGKVDQLGEEAKRALEGPEGAELKEAEAAGKARRKGEPAKKPTKKKPDQDQIQKERAAGEGMTEPPRGTPAYRGRDSHP